MSRRQTNMLRKARKAKHLTQQMVADMAGILSREYQRIERGERSLDHMGMRTGLSICAVLEINPYDALFGGPFVLNDFTVKKEEMAGVFAKATLDNISMEWEKQKCIPLHKPFNHNGAENDGRSLTEEVARATGLDVDVVFQILACEVCLLEKTPIRDVWMEELAHGISYMTKVHCNTVLKVLEAADDIFWENDVALGGDRS